MRGPGSRSSYFARGCGVAAVAVVMPLVGGIAPAHAQGLFDFFGLLSPPARAPVYRPDRYGPLPDFERPRVRHHRRAVRKDPEPSPVAAAPVHRAPGEVVNPVPGLLADTTLRRGDIVMFPDGARVFVGEAGSAHHAFADFAPLARAARAVAPSTRKLAARLLPSHNVAWSAGPAKAAGKVATNVRDVETTGSIKPRRR